MSAKFNNAITVACQAAGGYSTAIATAKTFAAHMERDDFKAQAMPIVAQFYRVKMEETNRGTMQLPRDSAAARALSRIVRDCYVGERGSNKPDPVAQCVASLASGIRKFRRLSAAKQRKVLTAAPHVTQLLRDFPESEKE